jgi:small subunit ribosomal protein S12
MVTILQLSLKKARVGRFVKKKKLALNNCPQKRGTCMKVHILTPRKPCSARRAMTRVRLSNKITVTCHIPGEGHNLKKFSSVLVRGGRPHDLPGVKYKVIRGARKTDLQPLYLRKSARSKCGVPDPTRFHRIRGSRSEGMRIYYT